MAYFLILPAFVVWLLIALAAVVATRLVDFLKPLYSYAWRVGVWATVGLIVANLVFLALLLAGFGILGEGSQRSSVKDAFTMAWGVSAILGPLVASLVGWLGGAAVGVFLAFRQTLKPVG